MEPKYKRGMTWEEAQERFTCSACKAGNPCEHDCVLSSTCSFKCPRCGTSNFFQGSWHQAPEGFECVSGCNYIFINTFRKRWGTAMVPPAERIDPAKRYTCGGRPVLGLAVELYNSYGEEVTFPVKGSVDMGKGKKLQYRIWTLNGQSWVGESNQFTDLVEVKEFEIKFHSQEFEWGFSSTKPFKEIRQHIEGYYPNLTFQPTTEGFNVLSDGEHVGTIKPAYPDASKVERLHSLL